MFVDAARMQNRAAHDRWFPMALVLVCGLFVEPASARDDALLEFADEPAEWLSAPMPTSGRTLLSLLPNSLRGARRTGRRLRIDVSPFVSEVVGWFRHAGIPLREDRSPQRQETMGISASLLLGDALPALSFWIGERSRETLGAFYSPRAGMSWALVWPVNRFTLRVEGGDDSEFGYFGVVGVHWRHPTQPLAVGVGVPMHMRNAEGPFGVIVQLRMNFD